MEFQLGPEVISSYKRLSYTSWFAFAEFIDNSTQAFLNNQSLMEKVLREEGANLFVKINVQKDDDGKEFIRIEDNSIGMSREELEKAVILGRPPANTNGRSKYGVGMKTAACWFGDFWTIKTKKYGETSEEYVSIDVERIAAGILDLNHVSIPDQPVESHYTEILIKKLNRKIAGRTVKSIKDYLGSIYRKDFINYDFQLFFQDMQLSWDAQSIVNRLIVTDQGPLKRDFSFDVGGKTVTGWAGVFSKGSRKDAGFTILQANRVIKGFPDSYRPSSLFGDQEGGSNDLVNQRLVGELVLDGFDVSHTKDEILFADDEQDLLEANLLEVLGDLRAKALSYRKLVADERQQYDAADAALNEFESELKSAELADLVQNYDLPDEDMIQVSNFAVVESVAKKVMPSLKVTIGAVTVFVFLSEDMSVYDPYVIIDSMRTKESVYILINKNHPHWLQLVTKDSVLNFIRHCVYDGVSEWKAWFQQARIDPDTIKNFKDKLLRVPFEMEKHGV